MATIIETSGKQREVEPANGRHFTLREMQDAVDGYVEVVSLADGRAMVINEAGHPEGKLLNREATRLYRQGRDTTHFIVGDVLICERRQIH